MTGSATLAILALFCTSCLVRIIPAFINFRPENTHYHYIERILPTAVFINFAVYILATEVSRAPLSAVISMAVVAIAAATNFSGLVTITIISSGLYYLLNHLL